MYLARMIRVGAHDALMYMRWCARVRARVSLTHWQLFFINCLFFFFVFLGFDITIAGSFFTQFFIFFIFQFLTTLSLATFSQPLFYFFFVARFFWKNSLLAAY